MTKNDPTFTKQISLIIENAGENGITYSFIKYSMKVATLRNANYDHKPLAGAILLC